MKKKIKKTSPVFPPEVKSDVSRKISAFNKKASYVKCVIVSGFCAGHNLKLTRCVEMRRVSNTEEDGRVTWPMREVAFLACPTAKLSVKTSSVNKAVSTEQPMGRNKIFFKM